MRAVTALLLGLKAPGSWQVEEFTAADAAMAQGMETTAIGIDLSGVDTKVDLMAGLAKALSLPAYFGKNFDALYDCLTDPPARSLIVITDGAKLLDADPKVGQLLAQVLQDASDYWLGRGSVMNVLWVGVAPPGTPQLCA